MDHRGSREDRIHPTCLRHTWVRNMCACCGKLYNQNNEIQTHIEMKLVNISIKTGENQLVKHLNAALCSRTTKLQLLPVHSSTMQCRVLKCKSVQGSEVKCSAMQCSPEHCAG